MNRLDQTLGTHGGKLGADMPDMEDQFEALYAAAINAAKTVSADLQTLARDVALEAIQQGARIELEVEHGELPVRVVPTAVRAAVANLVENAADASPAGSPIEMTIRRDGEEALVIVADRGPGLPEEVRNRLYAPHVTTSPVAVSGTWTPSSPRPTASAPSAR